MTAEDLVHQLEALKSGAVITQEDYCQARDALEEIREQISNNPALLSNECLDALVEIAMNSPHRDINDENSPLHHSQTPAQDICLYATRLFTSLAVVSDKRKDILDRVEKITADSLDYNVRNEALGVIWVLGIAKGQSPENRTLSVAALERQGMTNSNHYIRTNARDNVLSIATEYESFTARAMEAQIKGTEDTAAEARARATALLTNRVQSPTCLATEVISLLEVFKKVAAKTPSSDNGTHHWAAEGIKKSEERLKTGQVTEWKFP